jgi:hypothetical protein
MATPTREALLLPLSAADTERALDTVLAERGFARANREPPGGSEPVARSEQRFFAVDLAQPGLSLIREWSGYSDATSWGAALELAEGLPAASRMEMALPPASAVLARALSRQTTVVGIASREKPWHVVAVAFRQGRAADVITIVKDRIVVGAQGQPRSATSDDAKAKLVYWLAHYDVAADTVPVLLGERDLPAQWLVAYVHQ